MSPRGVPADEPEEDPELDAQWDDIVARLGDLSPADEPAEDDDADGPGDGADTPAPTAERADDGGAPAPDQADGSPRRRRTDREAGHTVRPAGPRTPDSDPRGWAPDPEVEEAEDHFEPPDPGPVFGGDPLLTIAWVVVVGAPTLAVIALVAWQGMPAWLLQAAGAAFVLAVGVLIWRMPHRRDADDDDPGAVV